MSLNSYDLAVLETTSGLGLVSSIDLGCSHVLKSSSMKNLRAETKLTVQYVNRTFFFCFFLGGYLFLLHCFAIF